MNLAFLADENVEMDIVDRLKSLGHTAGHASELFPVAPTPRYCKLHLRPGKFSSPTTRTSESLSFGNIIALPASYSFGCRVGLQPPRPGWLLRPSSAMAKDSWVHSW